MKIYLAADHAGFAHKEALKKALYEKQYEVEDFGAHSLDVNDDYPVFIKKAASMLSRNPENRAVLFGGSGEGEAIAANRFPNVRAAVFYGGTGEIVKLSREHNNANALSIGARFIVEKEALEAIFLWLSTPFSGEERHSRRIEQIDERAL